MAVLGWCITGHHNQCEIRQQTSSVTCDCCSREHKALPKKAEKPRPKTGKLPTLDKDQPKPLPEPTKEQVKRLKANMPEPYSIPEGPVAKLNKDGSIPKKRGRPKGSKNKPKDKA